MRDKHVGTFAALALLLAVGACGDSEVEAVGGAAGSPSAESDVVAGEHTSPAHAPTRRPLVVQNEDGTTSTVDVIEADGRTLFEGDIEVPSTSSTRGASIAGKRWPARTVPYVVDAALPYKARVTDAIAHWESRTSIRFVPRTNQTDYVRFTPGRGCSSPMGRVGSAQDVLLVAGAHITTLAGADFSPTTNRAHFWFKDGVRSVGRSSNVDEYELLTDYTLPAGKTTANVIDMAFAPNGDVYTWYRDRTFSIGTPSNLGSVQAPQTFALPAGRGLSAWNVLGLAFSADGHVHAWYADGTSSEGTAQDLGADVASTAFTLPAGQTASDVLAFGIANGGAVYAWYWGGKASGGTAANPAATWAPYAVKTPGHCGVDETIHELGHAVGLWHEQTRTDRDQYITIQWANIAAGNAYNFDLRTNGNDVGAYDYASIMHYDSYAFSANGAATITKKDGSLIADATTLSAGDIATVAWMYP